MFRYSIAIALIATLFLLIAVETKTIRPSCIDEDGNEVDWFLAYKFPHIADADHELESGFAYAYISDKSIKQSKSHSSSNQRTRPNVAKDQFNGNSDRSHQASHGSSRQNDTHKAGIVGRIRNLFNVSRFRRQETFVRQQVRDQRIERSSTERDRWEVSKKLITDTDSAIMRTLKILYSNQTLTIDNYPPRSSIDRRNDFAGSNKVVKSKINFVMYNDQEPDDENGDDSEEHERRNLNQRNNFVRSRSSISLDNAGNVEEGDARKSNNQKAHAKGVVIMDDITKRAIWLTHSVPHFPPRHNETFRFYDNAKKYGQTFMCITFDIGSYGREIIKHLNTMNPNVYDSNISDRLYQLVPDLAQLTAKRKGPYLEGKSAATQSVQKIKTLDGHELTLFSKSKTFNQDIYDHLMNDELKTDLYVETWRNGKGTPLNSSCANNRKHVNNVQDLQVTLNDRSTVSWKYSKDHSKWAISEEPEPEVVCVSDINRMKSQFKRGGGSVCMKCSTCWSVFSNTIQDVQPCGIDSRSSGKPDKNNRSNLQPNRGVRRN